MAVFVRVVDAGSFTAAAHGQGTTTSSVSKRVAQLEDRLGVRLLDRTTRKVALTEAGGAFYERCVRILADVEDAELAVTTLGGRPRGTLRVSAPVTFGEVHVAPRMALFLARYPDLRVDLSLSDRYVSLVEEGFDVAVRIGQLADSSLVARKLCGAGVVVCASPAYLAEHGTPNLPAELLQHNCLRYTLVSPQQEWRFHGTNGEFSVPVRGNFDSNHGGAMREAVLRGLGIARLPDFIVADALAQGTLRSLLDGYRAPDLGVFAVHPAGKHPPPKVTALIDFLAAELHGPRG